MSLLNEITAESNLFETRTLTVNGNNFNVIMKNSTKSKALLWLPGFNEYFYHYHISQELTDYDIYAIDFSSCGTAINKKDTPYNKKITHFEQIDKVIDEYLKGKGYTTIVLYGHSVGGLIATAYLNYYQHKFTKPIAFTRLILNNPLLTTNYTISFSFLFSQIAFFIGSYFPDYNLSSSVGNLNEISVDIARRFKFNPEYKSYFNLPVTLGFLHDIVLRQLEIQNGLYKLDIPIYLLRTDRKIDVFDGKIHEEKDIYDNFINLISDNVTETVIIDGGYDLLTSEGTLTGDTTALGKTILKFKEILNL